jgi:hypothetical protein
MAKHPPRDGHVRPARSDGELDGVGAVELPRALPGRLEVNARDIKHRLRSIDGDDARGQADELPRNAARAGADLQDRGALERRYRAEGPKQVALAVLRGDHTIVLGGAALIDECEIGAQGEILMARREIA